MSPHPQYSEKDASGEIHSVDSSPAEEPKVAPVRWSDQYGQVDKDMPPSEPMNDETQQAEDDGEGIDYGYSLSKSFKNGMSAKKHQQCQEHSRRHRMADFNKSVRNFNDRLKPEACVLKAHSSQRTPPYPFRHWTWERFATTFVGLISSCTVLTIRLYLDREPLAYVIHSIIVFIDMILIHIATHDIRLSVAGELLTVIFFLSFHFTKQTLWELMETTLLAVIVSFHLIGTRKEAIEERDDLSEEVRDLKRRGGILLGSIDEVKRVRAKSQRNMLHSIHEVHKDLAAGDMEMGSSMSELLNKDGALYHELLREEQGAEETNDSKAVMEHIQGWFESENAPARKVGHTFFEFFLDGAAGVMYTSFLGLIIDEAIHYNEKKY